MMLRSLKYFLVSFSFAFVMFWLTSWGFSYKAEPERPTILDIFQDKFQTFLESDTLSYGHFKRSYNKPKSYKPPFQPELGPKPSDKFVVPNVMHYVWFHPTKLTFRFHHYMSVLSAYKFNKPMKIYFWCQKTPKGLWWKRVWKEIPVIAVMYREPPTHVFGRKIALSEHRTDVIRLEAILNYGGIYTDLDVVVLKSFDPLRRYETSMGMEYADGLGNGIIVARRNAPFVRIMYESYVDFNNTEWSWHSVLLPYRLAAFFPRLVHVEPKAINQPNSWSTNLLFDIGKIFDWSGNYCLHLWYRMYDKDHTPQSIRNLDNTIGQVFRYIYYGNKSLLNPSM